jgi:hypothetical protein
MEEIVPDQLPDQPPEEITFLDNVVMFDRNAPIGELVDLWQSLRGRYGTTRHTHMSLFDNTLSIGWNDEVPE